MNAVRLAAACGVLAITPRVALPHPPRHHARIGSVTAHRDSAPVLVNGTTIAARLLDAVTGTSSARGTVVRALVIAPVRLGGRDAIVANDTVVGTVRDAGVERGTGKRYFMLLEFNRLDLRDGSTIALAARVADVPNAREVVDSTGRIMGPERPGAVHSAGSWAATLLATANPIAGAVFFAAFRGEAIERHRRIDYRTGTELTLRLTMPLRLTAWPHTVPTPAVTADERAAFTTAPLRATTAHDLLPADVVTLGLIGSDSVVARAFRNAGWTSPDRSSLRADLETLAKAAHSAGYSAQPVSTLLLGGVPPVFVFEKVVNSMARRHHLRIWRWGAMADGRPRWLVAASRDDGVLFSEQRKSFGHRIDPAIDVERDKVVNDLLTEGSVMREALLPRQAPTAAALVNGDTPVSTDWQLALLVLRPAAP